MCIRDSVRTGRCAKMEEFTAGCSPTPRYEFLEATDCDSESLQRVNGFSEIIVPYVRMFVLTFTVFFSKN